MYYDGFIYQLIENITDSLYHPIIDKNDDIIEISKSQDVLTNMILDILRDYNVLIESDEEDTKIPVIKKPDEKKADALKSRIKYHIAQIIKDYNREKDDYLSGVPIDSESAHTPFCFVDLEIKKGEKSKDELLQEYDDKFNGWANNARSPKFKEGSADTFICDYPFIRFYSKEKREKYFAIDLEYNVVKIALRDDIQRFAQFKPLSSRNIGMYYNNGRQSKLRTYDLMPAEIGDSHPTFIESIADMVPGQQYYDTVLDERASELVLYLVTGCYRNYIVSRQQNQNVKAKMETSGTLKEVVMILYPDVKKPSITHYEAARKYLMILRRVGITYKTEQEGFGTQIVLTDNGIFDKVQVSSKKNGKADVIYYHVELGQNYSKDLMAAQVSTIIKPMIDKLKSDISKLLYQDMKLDRLSEVMEADNQPTDHFYTIEHLQLMARVPGSKAEKRRKYLAAIQELVDNGVLINKYKTVKAASDGFFVTWLPLSETEINDVLHVNALHRDISLPKAIM